MAYPSVTNLFVNGQTSDGSQVNQNFTDLINGLSDGTKDLNVNAITCAGTATLNGSVVLGDAAADVITVNGTSSFVAAVTMKVAASNVLTLARDTTAGASTNAVGIRIGNSGTAQGEFTARYTNAAASGAPAFTMTHTPRNNGDTSNIDAVRMILAKTAGNNGGEFTLLTASSAGTLLNAINVTNTQNVVLGSAALATTATDGFLFIPTCAGVPTGVPTAQTGRVAIHFDTTNNKFYIYDGGWLGVTLS